MRSRTAAVLLLAALAVGLFAQPALSKQQHHHRSSDSNAELKKQPTPFRPGNEYTFEYNGQIASGLTTGADVGNYYDIQGDNSDDQKSAMRIQTQVKIHFQSEQRAALRLEQLRIGRLNGKPIEDPQAVQPMGAFERQSIDEVRAKELQLPCEFRYVDGVVEGIQFHQDDSTWSKNIKRSVLNLMQLNLKGKLTDKQQKQWSTNDNESQLNSMEENGEQQLLQTSFTIPETTIEGDCLTTYTINPALQGGNSQYDEQQEGGVEEEMERMSGQRFNVTKSVDFQHCQQIADVSLGFQGQDAVSPQCAQCQMLRLLKSFNNQGSQQQTNPCDWCDSKEVKEDQLDRSTVQRYQLIGRPYGSGQANQQQSLTFGIKRSEVVSHYVFRNLKVESDLKKSSAMHTIAIAELVFRGSKTSKSSTHYQLKQGKSANDEEDTLLYDNEWEVKEKRFYMYGDKEFNQNNSPFPAQVSKKAQEKAETIYRRLIQASTDKTNGIESETAVQLQRLVELLRMCNVQQLNAIYDTLTRSSTSKQSRSEEEKIEQLLADTFAIAGTRNTIFVLAEKIRNNKLTTAKVALTLKNLHRIPAPSNEIADILKGLCKTEVAHRSPSLHQSCWLTYGAMIGEMCRPKATLYQQKQIQQQKQWLAFGVQSGFDMTEVCSPKHKEQYKQTLFKEYKEAESTYENILMLKAIGNAGIDTAVNELASIASGVNERRVIVRVQAIDALRRLRNQMPRKIQRVLLPIFQNMNEKPEVRIASIAIIMSTPLEQPIVDQIAFALTKERSPEVQSFVYTLMQSYAQSKVPTEQKIAIHLKNALKLANIDEQLLRANSVKSQATIYSEDHQEGVAFKWVNVFSNNQMLPSYIGAGIDTIFNGQQQRDALQFSLYQQNSNGWVENVAQLLLNNNNGKQQQQQSTRGSRSLVEESRQTLRQIFSTLGVKSRSQNGGGSQQEEQWKQPFAMASIRIHDVDLAILPVEIHSLPTLFKKMLVEGKLSIEALKQLSTLIEKPIRSLSALKIIEKIAKVPTSVGVPLKIAESAEILVSADAQLRSNSGSESTDSKLASCQVGGHLIGAITHVQKMEVWTPTVSSGVASNRAIELNLPMNVVLEWSSEEGARVIFKLPQSPKTRVFGLHTLAYTYTRELDEKSQLQKEPRPRTIHLPIVEAKTPSRGMDVVIGGGAQSGMPPLRVSGHFHVPTLFTDYAQLAQICMASENHVHVTLEQSNDAPREIVFQVSGSLFRRVDAKQQSHTQQPELHNFYKMFEDAQPVDLEEAEEMNVKGGSFAHSHKNLENALKKLKEQSQSVTSYKHQLHFSARTTGGRKPLKADLKLSGVCDAKFKYCKVFVDAQRPPFYADESSEWKLKSKIQVLMPDFVSSVSQLEKLASRKNQKFVAQAETKWGAEHEQFINMRIKGEQAETQQLRQAIQQQCYENDECSDRQLKKMKRQTAFLNKYDVLADYKLKTSTQNVLNRVFELVKTYNFWNTISRTDDSRQARDGQFYATVIIDPLTQQQANVSVRTPTQSVLIREAQLPIQVRPIRLVRDMDTPTHSMSQFFGRLTSNQGAVCEADGRRVNTFDDVLYKAPITKCYSALAKDCSNTDEPEFAVLMKSLDKNGQKKSIKVVTQEDVIECEPVEEDGQTQIQCKINGKVVKQEEQGQGSSSEENARNAVVEYNNEEQTAATITVKGVSVKFQCHCEDCQCQKATIRLSENYKNKQCGLCGHFDDNSENEWRMSNNELTDDLAQFHQSYALKDEGECSEKKQNDFYKSNKNNFQVLNNQRSQGNQIQEDSQQQDEEFGQGGEWKYGGYSEDEEGSDENDDGYFEKSGGQRIQEPKMKTKMIEHGHKICFSVEPVKQCPSGTRPSYNANANTSDYEEDEEEEQSNNNDSTKMKFTCLSRTTPEARRLQRDVRRGVVVNVSSYEPNVVETVKQPTRCIRY